MEVVLVVTSCVVVAVVSSDVIRWTECKMYQQAGWCNHSRAKHCKAEACDKAQLLSKWFVVNFMHKQAGHQHKFIAVTKASRISNDIEKWLAKNDIK